MLCFVSLFVHFLVIYSCIFFFRYLRCSIEHLFCFVHKIRLASRFVKHSSALLENYLHTYSLYVIDSAAAVVESVGVASLSNGTAKASDIEVSTSPKSPIGRLNQLT